MNFELKIMGTASAMPISDRNPSAQVLSVHGRLFLIDCAEGTQQQIRRAHLSFLKIEAVFITHIHGDHLFGLFGLLSTMAMYGRTAPLYIYGPQALGSVLKFYSSFFADGSNFEVVFTPVSCSAPTMVHESRNVKVQAFPLNHKIECYGFRFDGIPSERHPDVPSYAYCSDTAPFEALSSFVKGVKVLYHEATYPAEMKDKAAFRYHSTTRDAALCAKEAGVQTLLIGHYSSRIMDFDSLLKECTDIFPQTVLCCDLMEMRI